MSEILSIARARRFAVYISLNDDRLVKINKSPPVESRRRRPYEYANPIIPDDMLERINNFTKTDWEFYNQLQDDRNGDTINYLDFCESKKAYLERGEVVNVNMTTVIMMNRAERVYQEVFGKILHMMKEGITDVLVFLDIFNKEYFMTGK